MRKKNYDIQYTHKFKKQYKKIKEQKNFKETEFEKVIEILSNNEKLPEKYHNHLLSPKSRRSMGMPHTTRCIVRVSKI